MGSQAVFPVDGPLYGNQRSVQGVVVMYVGPDGKAYATTGDLGPIDAGTTGAYITTSASAAAVAIPHLANGANPTRLRLVATAAAYVRLGTPDEVAAVVATTGTGYAPDDEITLAGGDPTVAAVLGVSTVKLISAALNAPGTGYVPADTITLGGGTHSIAAVATVATVKAVSATISAAGTGGTPGAATVTGVDGTGTKFQATVTISAGGVITSVNSISVAGSYSVLPADITACAVTGGSLTGATLSVVFGVNTFTVSTPGSYTAISAALTQAATSGAGVGATFQTAAYGVLTASVVEPGDYETFPTNPVAQDSTTGAGTGAEFTMTWGAAAAAGDLLVQPGDGVIVSAVGYEQVSAIRVTADGIVQISPL